MLDKIASSPRTGPAGSERTSVLQSIWADAGEPTAEVTTEEVREILATGNAIIVDTRSQPEFDAAHLPNARNIQTRADGPAEQYVEAVEHLVQGKKDTALVLYCNGPFCKRTRSLGRHLVAAGYSNVRRYQLGIPVWRALGGPTEDRKSTRLNSSHT